MKKKHFKKILHKAFKNVQDELKVEDDSYVSLIKLDTYFRLSHEIKRLLNKGTQ